MAGRIGVLSSLFIGIFLAASVRSQDCSSARTCDECVQVHRDCAWCTMPQRNAARRCQLRNEHLDSEDCFAADVVGESSSVSVGGVTLESNVTKQITVNLRPGATVSFQVTVERQRDFPVDLYYLLDTSNTMAFNLNNIRNTGGQIFTMLSNVTPRSRIGFGFFNDKPLPPFFPVLLNGAIFQTADGLNCGLESQLRTTCGTPTSFRHLLPLSTDIAQFQSSLTEEWDFETVVNGVRLTEKATPDNRRGSLDAMMQAATCQETLGWSRFQRGQAIRLIVVATDALYHSAGDGAYGGILEKHDGQCHLDGNGNYEFSTLQDYPSLGQVKDALDEEEILVIFALATATNIIYDPIEQFRGRYSLAIASDWESRALVVRFTREDNTTFLTTLVDAVRNASELASLQLSGENLDGISLTARAQCPSGMPLVPGVPVERCDGMSVGNQATFTVSLTASDCASLTKVRDLQLFVSSAYGVLNITLNPICSCNCTSQSEVRSETCSRLGNNTCGLCDCPEASPGDSCQCNRTMVDAVSSPSTGCRPMDAPAGTEPCNANGACEVSSNCTYGCTSCNTGFHGRYCQCADTLCNSLLGSNGLPCGGTSQGRCSCNVDTCQDCKCNCFDSFMLNNVCDFCTPSDAGCREGNRAPCSGRNGVCRCGTCTCTGGWTGPACSVCTPGLECVNALCTATEPCLDAPVECRGTTCYMCPGSSGLSTMACPGGAGESFMCSNNITTLGVSPPGFFSFDDTSSPTNVTAGDRCTRQVQGCTQVYYTAVDANNTIIGIVIDPMLICSESFNYLPVVLGIVFGLLGLAILILVIWKIVTFVLDRREYRQFLEAQKNAKWEKESNPLFKSPTQKFINPDYKGQSRS